MTHNQELISILLSVKGVIVAISETAFKYFTSKYIPEYCEMLLQHCSEGRSIETFAAKINNIPEALAYWANTYTDFEVCLRVAYWKSYAYWENLVIDDNNHIKELKTVDAGLYKLVMKHRFKWRDVADDLMLQLGKMSDKELESRAMRILEARMVSVPTIRNVDNEHN